MSKANDHWKVCYKGVPVWNYYRSEYHGRDTLAYSKKWCINLPSLVAFFKFLTLLFTSSPSIVVFSTSREQMNRFVEHHFRNHHSVMFFKRAEQLAGDSFFIEAIWYLFRKFGYLCDIRGRNQLASLVESLIDQPKAIALSNMVVGDYYYNRFLKLFLDGKQVYYSNCVIPKIEKGMNLHQSTELQHGVICAGHLDYAEIPSVVIKNDLLVWNSWWKTVISENVRYGGRVISSDFREKIYETNVDKTWDILVYSTVSDAFSNLILKSAWNEKKIALQSHPRDHFDYSSMTFDEVIGVNPHRAHVVYIHDSTLIRNLVENEVHFFYLALETEEELEVRERLEQRYGAILGKDYSIRRSIC